MRSNNASYCFLILTAQHKNNGIVWSYRWKDSIGRRIPPLGYLTSIRSNYYSHFLITWLLLYTINRHVTNFFLLIYQLGICCIYFVFIGENMKSIVDHFTKTDNDIRMFMLVVLLPIILLNWVSLDYCYQKTLLPISRKFSTTFLVAM